MRILPFLAFSFFCSVLAAQNYDQYFDQDPAGYYTGSLIRGGNSVQHFSGEIRKQGDSLVLEYALPDWIYDPIRTVKVNRQGNALSFELVYGQARLVYDHEYQEMTGTVGQSIPPINFHLKKSVPPLEPQVDEFPIKFKRKGAQLNGSLYLPKNPLKPLALAIFVHGRGCSSRSSLARKAKVLAEYGIATFAYDKRGSEASGFACQKSNHQLVTDDLVEITKELARHPAVDRDRIGYISYSAGGWIVPHAAEIAGNIAFMVTVVGPATSVLEQQRDGVRAYGQQFNYTSEAVQEALEYTDLTFSSEAPEATFKRMQSLLDSARKKGWMDWLADTDIPASADAISDLWVQKFRYDPTQALKKFNGPFLSLLGEEDPIVPYKIQIDRFEKIFEEAGKENYQIRVLANAGHGLQHGYQVRDLGVNEKFNTNPYYFKFYRNAHGSLSYLVEFLKDHQFLDK